MEIVYEKDHVHFLLQSVSTYSVSEILTKLKSLTAGELFETSGNKEGVIGWKFMDKCLLRKLSRTNTVVEM